MSSPPTVTFLRVADNASKLSAICSAVQRHSEQGERIVVATPNAKATEFVDQLLWKQPQEGFVPHSAGDDASDAPVVITHSAATPNDASVVINLREDDVATPQNFTHIYELWDATSPDKEQASQHKYQRYLSSEAVINIQSE